MKQIEPMKVTDENTAYCINVKGYRFVEDGKFLVLRNGNKRIHIVNGHYEYSEVDEHERRLFVKIITDDQI